MGLASVLAGLVPWSKREKVHVHYYGYAKQTPKPTIRVLMLKDAMGAPDGVTLKRYEAGKEYDLPEDLAGCFFSTGEADPAEAHMQPNVAEGAAEGAPQYHPSAESGEMRARRPRQRRGA